MSLNKTKVINPVNRIQMLRVLISILLGFLCVRLWYLQVLYGTYYRDKSENNRIRTVKLLAPRGRILDRGGQVLVRNRPSFNVGIMLEDVDDYMASIKKVSKITRIEESVIFNNFLRKKGSRRFEPRNLIEDVTAEQFARLKANAINLPGITFTSVPTRTYPNNELAAQIFGYIREVSKKQLEELSPHGYRMGDYVGQTGLEKYYEDILRGYSGVLQLEVDARGVRKQELGKVDSIPGRDIMLSLDLDLQKIAEDALGDFSGAVVALDPRDGQVLVLASKPLFDANIFSGELLAKDWATLMGDKRKPMLHRAISTAYPIGSTSKLLWSAVGLNEGVISAEQKMNCPGYFKLGRRRFLCNKISGHGNLDLAMAITVSCNSYFYNLGNTLGIETMSKYLSIFGFGVRTGIDLINEESGIAPSPKWKLSRFQERWYQGDTIPVSIGQGYFIATPLQLAQMGMIIANGGKVYKPRLIKAWSASNMDREMIPIEPVLKRDLVKDGLLKKVNLDIVKNLSLGVTEHPRGTAKVAQIPGIKVGGKTGTAQVVSRVSEEKGQHTKDHAWFIAYAPIENPEIVVSVIVENSGHGGTYAAPIAREVMYNYFDSLGKINHELEVKKTQIKTSKSLLPQEVEHIHEEDDTYIEEIDFTNVYNMNEEVL